MESGEESRISGTPTAAYYGKEPPSTKWRTKGKGDGAFEEGSSGEVEKNKKN